MSTGLRYGDYPDAFITLPLDRIVGLTLRYIEDACKIRWNRSAEDRESGPGHTGQWIERFILKEQDLNSTLK